MIVIFQSKVQSIFTYWPVISIFLIIYGVEKVSAILKHKFPHLKLRYLSLLQKSWLCTTNFTTFLRKKQALLPDWKVHEWMSWNILTRHYVLLTYSKALLANSKVSFKKMFYETTWNCYQFKFRISDTKKSHEEDFLFKPSLGILLSVSFVCQSK